MAKKKTEPQTGPYECDVCNASFHTEEELQKHLKTHDGGHKRGDLADEKADEKVKTG
ncbi:MAG: C2H2-type zinc finger protein [Anaerolineales bacterium]